MLFGEIVEPGTRALIFDDDEFPEYKSIEPEWKGKITNEIETLLFVESEKILTLVKKFVIASKTPTLSLVNGGINFFEVSQNKYVVLCEDNKNYCSGELITILKDYILKAKFLYSMTSKAIVSYENPDLTNRSDTLIKCLSTNEANTYGYTKLESPNIITGLGANILSYSVHTNLQCSLFNAYMDNSPLDSRNSTPILNLIGKLGFTVLPCDLKMNAPAHNLYM
ncbi:uncharacterized protein LOC109599619 [Aethina tumida]|uniref:uncharacterized protein LOC109599619 n=1 Tax=Aethina tumida TaxID=116153 RepID=UPI0021476786|nr:uncharacterized protein LOC109599619 [Aethina tumida]